MTCEEPLPRPEGHHAGAHSARSPACSGTTNLAAATALGGGIDDRMIAHVRPRHADQVAHAQAGMGGKLDGEANLRRAGRLERGDVGIEPDDVGAVAALVELLDAGARVARELAQRVDGEGQDAREHRHAHVGRARRRSPLVTPPANDRPDAVGTIELRDAQAAEMLHDAIEPRPPALPRHRRELVPVRARLVRRHHAGKPARVGRVPLGDGFVVAVNELRRAWRTVQARAAAPCVMVRLALRRRLGDALQLNLHVVPRSLLARDRVRPRSAPSRRRRSW